MAVVFGDWAAIGKALAGLPNDEAVAGYTRLLRCLGRAIRFGAHGLETAALRFGRGGPVFAQPPLAGGT